jgi:spore coat protein U-like protein
MIKNVRSTLGVVLTLAVAVLAASPAWSQSATDTLSVQVTVQNSCSVSGTTINFGTYTSGQTANLDAQGNITYNNCPEGTLTISLDGGTSNNISNRTMSAGGGDSLRYQLYKNSGRTQIWGSDVEGLQQVLLVPGSGEMPVYGRVLSGQSVASGTYSDTVNITMTF